MLAVTMFLAGCAGTQFDTLDDFIPSAVSGKPDFEAISTYATYAQTAYLDEDVIRARYPGTVRINAPQGTKTRYFLDVQPSRRLQTISVRGTKTFGDVLHDIEFAIVEDVGLQLPLHKGFEADARLIYADVKPFLRKDFTTRVTGHSLGAAVSAILMIYLERDGFTVERSINFGQPKFTNIEGAERYKSLRLQRVVDRNDVVPMLPPPLARHPRHGAYAHVGEEIILLDGPEFIQLDNHDSERISVDNTGATGSSHQKTTIGWHNIRPELKVNGRRRGRLDTGNGGGDHGSVPAGSQDGSGLGTRVRIAFYRKACSSAALAHSQAQNPVIDKRLTSSSGT